MPHANNHARTMTRQLLFTGAAAVFFSLTNLSPASADRITLRGGGQIRGKVLPDPKSADRVMVLTERGKTPIRFQRAQILEVVAEESALDAYLVRLAETPETAEAEYSLGEWCGSKKLADLAALHFETALSFDKGFAPAHKKLGHVLIGGRWLAGDELREAQGLVKYKGKWVTREESEHHEKDDATAAEQGVWIRRIRLLREAMVYGADDRRREAETQFMEIRDPSAVGPLIKVLGADVDAMRRLLPHVLGVIPGSESALALVNILVHESDGDIRHSYLDELNRRTEPEINKRLVRALRAEQPEIINRAAWALANLKVIDAVPSLINALVTSKDEVVMAPAAGAPAGGMNMGVNFNSGPIFNPGYGVPVAFNGSSVGYLTGPVVAPGVVAFGATGVPAYGGAFAPAYPNIDGSSLAQTPIAAGGGVNGTRGPVPKILTFSVQNVEVHAALVKLTGQDFGYDLPSWRIWLRTSFHAESAPAKRVPQP